jgi:hypothetical protein
VDSLERTRKWKIKMKFGSWNVRCLYRSVSLKTATSELAKYKLDLVGTQDVRRDKLVNEQQTLFYISVWKWECQQFLWEKLLPKGIVQVVREEIVSDRMSWKITRVHWCDIIVLNVHVQTGGKSVFNHFLKYHVKLEDFNAKVRRADIFVRTIRNNVLHEISNENELRY